MQKEEVVVLHLVLFHVKRILEEAGIANGHFRAYENLGISPVNINRSKSDHKKAVLLLCKGIAEVFRTNQAKLLQNPRIKESIEMAKIIAH
ncbi:MAG: hypothetical protein DSO01_04085 [Archaeoglobi archaeon]|jgi:hypothetical protein|nr:UPF0058 family protein [Archaeoglobus sp.]NHW88819.1 hypothetical protein [Archaeoglobales archaeon]TDA27038.1 MAG: hypothetical protein DSO01_04085 [Archaeoglobi archaeon]TDA28353.1 MAG: hypothetical protein DSN99_02515 [Archaeoglobi archaeon]